MNSRVHHLPKWFEDEPQVYIRYSPTARPFFEVTLYRNHDIYVGHGYTISEAAKNAKQRRKDRKPAEVWPVGHFIENEMRERRWTKRDLLLRLGGGPERKLELDLLFCAPTKGVILDKELAAGLARVFGTSAEMWLDLDQAWQENVGDQ